MFYSEKILYGVDQRGVYFVSFRNCHSLCAYSMYLLFVFVIPTCKRGEPKPSCRLLYLVFVFIVFCLARNETFCRNTKPAYSYFLQGAAAASYSYGK
jgi:hypothetical protein